IHRRDLALRLASSRENDIYLPGFRLPGNVEPCNDLGESLERASVVLSVMPSRYVRPMFADMLPFLTPQMSFVTATKGIEAGSLFRMSQVIQQVIRPRFEPRIAVLSGPTFAREIARGEPAALVISATDRDLAKGIQQEFSGLNFRLYVNDDPVGVELGAALKNVIAIGAGISHGLNLGSNSSAALITRGLAEITRLAIAMGGKPRTLAGLAGLGDLVLTCMGKLSRNRTVGVELARGRKLAEIVSSTAMIAEGVETTAAAVSLSDKFHTDMPITEQMGRLLRDEVTPREAIRSLMQRSLTDE
ncbi:MAG: NAD(P)-dependent glycerol-3-phosphate dehydrogenase, partial [Acidobacteriota bacterium]|nr:NAD(P)-dependent glycerol-3-phosphate dehydrogenase [Acidobacteriota bacterium]